MKLIIAGGRDYSLSEDDIEFLDSLLPNVTEVVSGGARGADAGGEQWAKSHGMTPKVFEADWKDLSEPCVLRYNRYGKPYNAIAGNKRNIRMAEYADALVLFPGGKGTANMYQEAKKRGLVIYDRRSDKECNYFE